MSNSLSRRVIHILNITSNLLYDTTNTNYRHRINNMSSNTSNRTAIRHSFNGNVRAHARPIVLCRAKCGVIYILNYCSYHYMLSCRSPRLDHTSNTHNQHQTLSFQFYGGAAVVCRVNELNKNPFRKLKPAAPPPRRLCLLAAPDDNSTHTVNVHICLCVSVSV